MEASSGYFQLSSVVEVNTIKDLCNFVLAKPLVKMKQAL